MYQKGHECILIHQGKGRGRPAYPIPEGVKIINLSLSDAASLQLARGILLAQDPDVLCALTGGHEMLWLPALCNNTGIPLLLSEHRSPQTVEKYLLSRQERLACMAGADAIHLLCRSFPDSLPAFLRGRAVVIPNSAKAPMPVDWRREQAACKKLLAVGRFEEDVKQYASLIKAFAQLAEEFGDWILCLCGDGPDREKYIELIRELHLEARVELPGIVENVDTFYAAAHLLCIPSRDEAFGMVTLEAQRHALPVVGFAACNGVNEIIVNGKNGLLAEAMSVPALTAALRQLMGDSTLRRRLGEKGQAMLKRYAAEKVYDQWEKLLRDTASFKHATRLQFPEFSEQAKTELALQEILSRPHPQSRALCMHCGSRREVREQALRAGVSGIRNRLTNINALRQQDSQA
jgi:glycosyltransferase involved in cell wall biosynthesis